MKAIILARVSTEEQKEAGNSLPAQVKRLEDYCQRKGFEIVETFSFDESAYKTKRDEFDKVIALIENQKEKVIVCFDKVDRLSRNIFDPRVPKLYQMARDGKIEIHFASDGQILDDKTSSLQKTNFNMSLVFAEYYSSAISDNVKRAFEAKRRRGEATGPASLGYKNDSSLDGKKIVIPDPDKAHLVTKLFELYATGNYSIKTLRTEITRLGLRTREGKEPSMSVIENILKKTVYTGLAYSKKYNLYYPLPKLHPLVTKEVFDKCQDIRTGRKLNVIFKSKSYIFGNCLLHCKDCGCAYSPETHKGLNYYSCTNSKGICKKELVREEVLLEPIYGLLGRFEGIPEAVQNGLVNELRKTSETEVEYHNKEIKRIQSEYLKVQEKIDRLLDAFLEQTVSITKDIYDKKMQSLKDQQTKLGIELEEHTKADHDYKTTIATVFTIARNAKKIFDSSETHEKRAFLNFILQNPVVNGKNLEFTTKKPWNLVLELASTPTWLRG